MLPQRPIEDTAAPLEHMAHGARDMEGGDEPGWRHWGLMVLCCLPMITIAVLLIAGIWR